MLGWYPDLCEAIHTSRLNKSSLPTRAISPIRSTGLKKSNLVYVHEVWVLLIRHIPKRRRVLRKSMHFSTFSQPFSLLFLGPVLPDVHVSQQDEDQKLDTVRHQERADTQTVSGCLIGLVEEGTRDIAHTDTEPDHAGNDHFLGLARCVGGDD